jgi:nucleoid DNA-binding protein
MAKVLTKSQIIQAITDAHKEKLSKKSVAGVLESLTNVGHKELKKNGIFVLPGFAKFIVIKKPATKEPGSPFTKEPSPQGRAGPQGAGRPAQSRPPKTRWPSDRPTSPPPGRGS